MNGRAYFASSSVTRKKVWQKLTQVVNIIKLFTLTEWSEKISYSVNILGKTFQTGVRPDTWPRDASLRQALSPYNKNRLYWKRSSLFGLFAGDDGKKCFGEIVTRWWRTNRSRSSSFDGLCVSESIVVIHSRRQSQNSVDPSLPWLSCRQERWGEEFRPSRNEKKGWNFWRKWGVTLDHCDGQFDGI